VTPAEARVEGYCRGAYPNAHVRIPVEPEALEAYRAGELVGLGGRGMAEGLDLEYLRELGGAA
jgi:hypothetical protein